MHPNTTQNPATNTHSAPPTPYGGPVTVTPSTPAQPGKLIRLPAVCELTGLGKSSVYSIADFPKRVVLSRRAVGWRLSEVMAWIEGRSTVEARA